MFDIAIIGAGPAGATLARLLPPGYRTLLVDRRRLDRPFEPGTLAKPCGGLLAPAAQAELARQGLGVPEGVAIGPQLFAVRTLDLAVGLEQLYQRFYINVDREAFDRWLVSLAPPHVERGFGWSMHALSRDPEGAFLHFRTPGGGSAGVRARLVIGAEGANSIVRRLAFPSAASPARYVAMQAAFESVAAEPFYGAIFDERLTDYYGWTIPKGGELVIGAAFPSGADAGVRFDALVERLHHNGARFGGELSRRAAQIVRPAGLGDLVTGHGGVLLVGEAAGFISPSSGEGISYALASAATLAQALRPGLSAAESRYRLACTPIAARVCAKRVKSSAIYGPTTRRLIMRSGLGAIVPSATGWRAYALPAGS